MDTLLIIMLLGYNAWLVYCLLQERRQKENPQPADKPMTKPPQKSDDIVGKSLFKMESRTPISAKPTPNTATLIESEDVTNVDVTFADERDEAPSARLPDDKLDEAFSDIRISDVPQQYADEDEQDDTLDGKYASGNSFEEIGKAVSVADNPVATSQERQRAGQIFSEMEGNELLNKMIESNPELGRRIMGLMDEISGKHISGEGEAIGNVVQPQTITEVPADISGFDIRDFV